MGRPVKSCWDWDYIATFQTLQTWIGHVAMFETDSSVTSISVIFNTHYQTLQTWISINATLCDSLKTHSVITRIITRITMYFSQICLVWGYLQHVIMHYDHFLKKCYEKIFEKNILKNIYILNLIVVHGYALQIPPNQAELRENVRSSVSYGNMLRYGLSMLNWEKMYGNACGNACGNALKLW